MEQFLRVLNPDLCTWVKARNPTTYKQVAEIAKAFLAARCPQKCYTTPRPSPPPPSSSKTAGGNEHRFRSAKQSPMNTTSSQVREFKHKDPSVCHSCGQTNHFKAECPGQQVSKTHMSCTPESFVWKKDEVQVLASSSDHEYTTCVFIEEKPCVALLDSDSSRTLVRQDYLPRDVTFSGKEKVW